MTGAASVRLGADEHMWAEWPSSPVGQAVQDFGP